MWTKSSRASQENIYSGSLVAKSSRSRGPTKRISVQLLIRGLERKRSPRIKLPNTKCGRDDSPAALQNIQNMEHRVRPSTTAINLQISNSNLRNRPPALKI